MASEHLDTEPFSVSEAYMDYERCAALHNELLTRAVKGCGCEMPLKPRTWWERAYDNEALPKTGRPGPFFFLGGLMWPDDMMLFQNEFYDDWDDRFLKLYGSSCFLLSDDEGLLFDQETLKAAFVADNNDTTGVCFHEWTWMPLEDILGAYLQMIDEEKVEAVPSCRWKIWGNQPNQLPLIEPWAIHAYTATDMEKTLSAFKRLVEAIDSRIPGKDESTYTHLPWHDPVTLAHAFIPLSSFAHEFLSAVSHLKVRFRYIAPGIRFPTVSEFLDQVMTDFTDSPYTDMGEFPGDCPLRLFIIDAEELVRNKDYPSHPMPAGLYNDRVVVGHPQYWSNECELLLPFGIGANGWVRQSNGQPFGVYINDQDLNQKPGDGNTLLYQSGCPDGFTFRYHVQIHNLLENWVKRV
ncbi:hypothetical protein BDV09DRAFT_196619 [Aspergillus tetrazonus]